MKVKHVRIENFKGIKGPLEIDFTGPDGEPRPLTCILGDNGSGKTTVLQAIALTLSLATRKTPSADKFQWPGYLAHRVASFGTPQIKIIVGLNASELRVQVPGMHQFEFVLNEPKPQPQDQLTLICNGFGLGILGSRDRALSLPARNAFLKAVQSGDERFKSDLLELGDVFWFDQNRNIANTSAESSPNGNGSEHPGRSWSKGVSELRKALVYDWLDYRSPHVANPEVTFVGRLQAAMGQIFPGLEFFDARRKEGSLGASGDDVEVLLRRRDRIFELSEMSSGEQAVFPLMYEFVRQDIHHSVVLIDELELHLHPPQQQALLRALRQIGPDCQFIVTTHSEDVAGGFFDHQIVRLPGGRLCL